MSYCIVTHLRDAAPPRNRQRPLAGVQMCDNVALAELSCCPARMSASRSPPYMGVEVKRYVISGCPFAMQTRCRSVVDLSEVEPARTHAEHRSASPYIRSGPCP